MTTVNEGMKPRSLFRHSARVRIVVMGRSEISNDPIAAFRAA
jgi:hypothetical protein